MSYYRRIVELIECDCDLGVAGINNIGGLVIYPVKTVHCENSDGQMRCEVCGKIKE